MNENENEIPNEEIHAHADDPHNTPLGTPIPDTQTVPYTPHQERDTHNGVRKITVAPTHAILQSRTFYKPREQLGKIHLCCSRRIPAVKKFQDKETGDTERKDAATLDLIIVFQDNPTETDNPSFTPFKDATITQFYLRQLALENEYYAGELALATENEYQPYVMHEITEEERAAVAAWGEKHLARREEDSKYVLK